MKAEIIAVGNEVITGHTVNTNASEIAIALQEIGIMPKYHSGVCDEKKAIEEALKLALNRVEVVVLTGGLGPTKDDLTKETVCEYLKMPMVLDEVSLRAMAARFEKMHREMPDNNKKQAEFPPEAVILPNHNGTAPGCILTLGHQYIVLLPGPPKEMKPMLRESVLPYFKNILKAFVKTEDIQCFGIGESALAEKIDGLLGEFEWGSVATYISGYKIIVRITARGQDKSQVEERVEAVKKQIVNCLGTTIIGYNEDKLEEQIKQLLAERKEEVATVESCTGGLLAGTLVNCSGISAYFKQGIVTYSNEAKMKYVGVKEETLRRYGAVSEQTAKEMAEGIKRVSGAQIGLSTTGVAGPDGGTLEKPVGLVYIGLALPQQTYVYELRLNGSRQEVREKTVQNVLFRLYQLLT